MVFTNVPDSNGLAGKKAFTSMLKNLHTGFN